MKNFILPLFVLLLSLSTFAQHKGREKIKALKVSFITEKLDLTAQEAQQFWPIYNAYDDITTKLKYTDIKRIRREIKQNFTTISNERANELLTQLSGYEKQLHEEDIKLISKLRKVLSPKKIISLRIAEEDFKRKLFERFKQMRQNHKKPE
ncbi:sensor of ECF-type sigma factor [Thalassobellus sediminis]|uniref:sensor of ECF-type sigma factor n=1 Tax=Thalassobellus sediminis TaxID=3367753 RepID=UPI0037B1A762